MEKPVENPGIDMLKEYIKSKSDIFQRLGEDKQDSLKDSVEDINKLISERENLTKDIFKDIDKIKTDINNFILQLGDPSNKEEQLKLRQKQVEIELLKIQEKVNSFRDIATLKKELRERNMEITEKETRSDILDQILSS